MGHKCNYTTNTCEEDVQIRHCRSRVVLTNGLYELQQFCIANFVPCLKESELGPSLDKRNLSPNGIASVFFFVRCLKY